MNLIIKENYEEMSKAAAGIIAQLVRKKPGCVLGLATGRTPIGTYRELIRMHKEEDMPHFALTMGIGTILESKHALMIANGKKKAAIIAEAIQGCITSKIPATALQLHPGKVTVILDVDAASKLTWSVNNF